MLFAFLLKVPEELMNHIEWHFRPHPKTVKALFLEKYKDNVLITANIPYLVCFKWRGYKILMAPRGAARSRGKTESWKSNSCYFCWGCQVSHIRHYTLHSPRWIYGWPWKSFSTISYNFYISCSDDKKETWFGQVKKEITGIGRLLAYSCEATFIFISTACRDCFVSV